MKLTFGDILETTEAVIGYISRLKGEGLSAVARDAYLWALPGYFTRADDSDDDTTGTEDAIVVENGDERIAIATNNAKAWQTLLDYLGRALDKGERLLSASDGTGRSYVTVRPGGKVTIRSDSGGGDVVTIEADPSTGDMTVSTTGDVVLASDGVVKIGDVAAPEYVTMFTALKSEFDALVTAHNTHNHPTAPPGGVSTPSVTAAPLTNAPRSAKGRVAS